MPAPVPYFEVVRQMKNTFDYRLRLVTHARQHGMKAAARKESWAWFQQISADTKDLDDRPHYWPQMKAHGLPVIQYTAREVRSGLQFLASASQSSAQASTLFAQHIQVHLARCGVHLRDVTWQTDNGSEFIGELQPDGSRSHFPAAVTYFGSQHQRIPPAAPSRTSSTTWKTSAPAPSSSPRPRSISSISTWLGPTLTSEV